MSVGVDDRASNETGGGLEVAIERTVHGGLALGRTKTGEVVLVRGAIPGEKVLADVRSQKGVLMGTTLRVLEPSPDRVPVSFHPGLDFSHMAYARQLVEKRAVVADALARARRQAKSIATPTPRRDAAEVAAVRPAPGEWAYRSGIQPATAPGGLGYRRPESSEVVVMGADPVATAPVDAAWQRAVALRAHAARGAVELVIRANDEGHALIAIVASTPARRLLPLAHALVHAGITGVALAPHDPRGRFRSGAERLAGERTILQRYGDVVLSVTASSFAQPNPAAAGELYRELAGWAGAGESAVELFAGGGAISFHLAPAFARVMAVEIDRGAVMRGERDAARLGIANVEFVRQDARQAPVPTGAELVVVDPPRAGLSADVRAAVQASGADRLLYVSCDVATWARDVADLETRGFRLARFVPYDFYPQTHHVELLSELVRA